MEHVACHRSRLSPVLCGGDAQQRGDVKSLMGAAIFCEGMSARSTSRRDVKEAERVGRLEAVTVR